MFTRVPMNISRAEFTVLCMRTNLNIISLPTFVNGVKVICPIKIQIVNHTGSTTLYLLLSLSLLLFHLNLNNISVVKNR